MARLRVTTSTYTTSDTRRTTIFIDTELLATTEPDVPKRIWTWREHR